MTAILRGVTERIDPLATQALQARLLGDIVQPGDGEYDMTRRTHILNHDRHPALIVRAADAGDVIRAVEFARARDLPLAVRSGGHSISGYSSVDDGVVVDLSGMKGLSIDPERRTGWAQPGVTSADMFKAAEPYGLGLSTGDTASVGLGGLTLGGGIGFMVRKYGLTIDSLLSVELVTADGRIIVASEDQHPELFWALRGGGGNFGIATAFEFRLNPVGMVLGGALVLPPTPDVLRGYAAYAPAAPDGLSTIGALMYVPPVEPFPAEAHGKLVFMVLVCYVGDIEEGQKAIDPLRSLAAPLADMTGPMPYSAMFELTAMGSQPHPVSLRSGYMNELSDEAIGELLDQFVSKPAPFAMVQLRGLGGAMGRVPADATAFAHRDKPLFLAIINVSAEEADTAWTVELWNRMRPFTDGVYVNFLDDEGEGRIREAYVPSTYERLSLVKRKYDPTNLFNLNQNIRPALEWSPAI
ncbi:MAG: FAD-binding oxidoreductase [Thermomicrobiales bacterium]